MNGRLDRVIMEIQGLGKKNGIKIIEETNTFHVQEI